MLCAEPGAKRQKGLMEAEKASNEAATEYAAESVGFILITGQTADSWWVSGDARRLFAPYSCRVEDSLEASGNRLERLDLTGSYKANEFFTVTYEATEACPDGTIPRPPRRTDSNRYDAV